MSPKRVWIELGLTTKEKKSDTGRQKAHWLVPQEVVRSRSPVSEIVFLPLDVHLGRGQDQLPDEVNIGRFVEPNRRGRRAIQVYDI